MRDAVTDRPRGGIAVFLRLSILYLYSPFSVSRTPRTDFSGAPPYKLILASRIKAYLEQNESKDFKYVIVSL